MKRSIVNCVSHEQESLIKENIGTTPKLYQQIYRDSLYGLASPMRAVKAKCLECVCFENAKNMILGCTSYQCPLWAYRPYQKKDPNRTKQEQPEALKKAQEAKRNGK